MRFKLLTVLSLITLFTFLFSCNKESLGDSEVEVTNQEESMEDVDGDIWVGPAFTFTKPDGAPANDAANQDRITDNVWLTRGNNGGQIFNAKTESGANKNSSPEGTAWAVGTIDEVNELQFTSFRAAVGKPKDVVGKDLVLHLIDDNIYLSVKFTSWSENKNGGFAYERSTAE